MRTLVVRGAMHAVARTLRGLFEQRLGVTLIQTYGQSETGPIATIAMTTGI